MSWPPRYTTPRTHVPSAYACEAVTLCAVEHCREGEVTMADTLGDSRDSLDQLDILSP